ncbi:hypothetical protein [Nocardia farcinica]|uniref:hypothetical protein n=1 Tax=Nocardia farcinica TaxID=37329 RepID=UPI00189413D0|nr:hypothetical protein [Nocardia farcinica]MBF6187619.1 hypothetical protein [Nocardia farcinica]MBF6410985.1 hypothetical protein [Nocardia farcinica]
MPDQTPAREQLIALLDAQGIDYRRDIPLSGWPADEAALWAPSEISPGRVNFGAQAARRAAIQRRRIEKLADAILGAGLFPPARVDEAEETRARAAELEAALSEANAARIRHLAINEQLRGRFAELEKRVAELEGERDKLARLLAAESARVATCDTCDTCHGPIHWIECPTGGWWAHDTPAWDDHHDAVTTFEAERGRGAR